MTIEKSLIPNSRTRIGPATAALATGTFVIGMTEFITMGLLPEIATSMDRSVAETGRIITTYASGVLVGVPLIVAMTTHLPRRALTIGLVLALGVGNLLTALAMNYETLHVARFLAGLPHAAYFGAAQVLASSLVAPIRQGRAVAYVGLGLTLSSITAVPAGTWLGQVTNWRVPFLVIFVLSLVAAITIWAFVPRSPGDKTLNVRAEFSALRRPEVLFGSAGALLTSSGIFVMYAYIAPLVTDSADLSEASVPVAMLLWGLGSVFGGLIAGRIIESGAIRSIVVGNLAMIGLLVGVTLVTRTPVALFLLIFLIGLLGPPTGLGFIVYVMNAAGRAQLLATALTSASFNASNGLGALIGSIAVMRGMDYGSTGALGAGVTLFGLAAFCLGLLFVQRARSVR